MMKEEQYGAQLYQVLFDFIGNKKNNLLLESLRGENAVLSHLARYTMTAQGQGIHAGDLSDTLSLVPGRMTDILKNLEKKGLIIREKDPDDKRRVLVSITKDGLSYVKNKREQVRVQYSSIYQELGEKDTLKLIELLNKVNAYFK